MSERYIPRDLETVLRRSARQFPAVVLTGPRQSGKTTVLKHLFGKRYQYVSLEPPDIRAAAASDPRGFLDLYRPPVIFDEVQYAPEILGYVKEKIDAKRHRRGQYILTGSQNLLLIERVTETLAGRAAMLRLLPLSHSEAAGRSRAKLPWESQRVTAMAESVSARTLWKTFLRGAYPELVTHPRHDATLWHSSYVQTYLERDVRTLRQVGDLTQFQAFLRTLAARSAQLLNITNLARDLGIAVNTVKAWLSVLEATYQVIILRPYHANITKRLVKMPKIYFTDVGTLCHLVQLQNSEHAAAGPMGGTIMETAVLAEIVKRLTHRGVEPRVSFWRTAAGHEVDFLVETNGKLIPIEVKLSATPKPAMATGIESLRVVLGSDISKGYVVCPGHTPLPLGPHALALPFSQL